MSLADDLEARARDWLAHDPDPDTRTELEALLRADDGPALTERFTTPLQFGTAGLRGLMGAGPARMNLAVVARIGRGLCTYLEAALPNAQQRGLCIGFDGRHKSRDFAEETARIAARAGFVVRLFDAPVPTPLLAYAVREQRAAAGVMITASHNPAAYNGYKVYWHDGVQIVPPHDTGIATAAEAAGPLDSVARPGTEPGAASHWLTLGAASRANYLCSLRTLYPAPARQTGIRLAYTALHGVGRSLAVAALEQAGFSELHCVPEQADPDPDFPTVRFPNPEEPGAMDRVLDLGERVGAALCLANDPDADRLRVAARDATGRLVPLSGNDLGALLANYVLGSAPQDGRNLVIRSVVTSSLLDAIARSYGAQVEVTLTGFKWICHRALEREATDNARFVFGFEEAIGYCAGSLVGDKDGISAAVLVAQLASTLAAEHHTLWDALHALWRAHGVHLSGQRSLTLTGPDAQRRMADLMQRARSGPPTSIAGLAVLRIQDLLADPELPKSDGLLYHLDSGQRIALRPSGTEPKVKLYFDAHADVNHGETTHDARLRTEHTLRELEQGIVQWLRLDAFT